MLHDMLIFLMLSLKFASRNLLSRKNSVSAGNFGGKRAAAGYFSEMIPIRRALRLK
jgi:hypothetical protein